MCNSVNIENELSDGTQDKTMVPKPKPIMPQKLNYKLLYIKQVAILCQPYPLMETPSNVT